MAQKIRVAICAYGLCKTPGCTPPGFNLDRNLRQACALLQQARSQGVDLAVLPETFALQHCANWDEKAEPMDGRVIATLSRQARKLGMGIAAGQATLEGGKRYNSIVLLDRGGKVAAVYHKTFPTIWELERGIVPGTGACVVDTEFGRLGFAICYDLNFAQLRQEYRRLAPQMIVFASAFRGGLQARWWAFETRSYLVSAVIDPQSVIVNPLGRIVAETDAWTRVAACTLNLDCQVIHYDYTSRTLASAFKKYGRYFEFEWAEPEGVMLVTAKGRHSARWLMTKMGWENAEAYFERFLKLRDAAVAGKPIPKGKAPW